MAYVVHDTLVAATAEPQTVSIASGDLAAVEVLHRDTADANPIYFTIDGSTAVAEADDNFVVMSGQSLTVPLPGGGTSVTVSLISAGTPDYTVTAVPA